MTLRGKTVAITGAGRGIGLATAKAFAQLGAKVAIGDIEVELAESAAQDLAGFGGFLDVRRSESFEEFLTAAEQALGPVDILVNNAGIMPTGAFHKESEDITDTQIAVNLKGVIVGSQLAVQRMLPRQQGHIVNVASMAGRLAIPGLAVYCATKFAVVGLTESLREEYRDQGIHFTTILPAKVTTELAAGTDGADLGIPSSSPEEVAKAIVKAVLKQQGEVAVPSYLGALNGLQGMAPHRLLRGIRRVFKDQRILHGLDETARQGYNQRIKSLSHKER